MENPPLFRRKSAYENDVRIVEGDKEKCKFKIGTSKIALHQIVPVEIQQVTAEAREHTEQFLQRTMDKGKRFAVGLEILRQILKTENILIEGPLTGHTFFSSSSIVLESCLKKRRLFSYCLLALWHTPVTFFLGFQLFYQNRCRLIY